MLLSTHAAHTAVLDKKSQNQVCWLLQCNKVSIDCESNIPKSWGLGYTLLHRLCFPAVVTRHG